MSDNDFPTDRDLLLGVDAIYRYLVSLTASGSEEIKIHQVRQWITRGYLPVRRIGARVIGSKAAIKKFLTPSIPD